MEDRLGQGITNGGALFTQGKPFFFITVNNTYRNYSSRSLHGCFSSREIKGGLVPTSNGEIILAPKELVFWSDP